MGLELRTFWREYGKTLLESRHQVAKRPKNVMKAKRVDCSDVVMRLVARLNVVAKSRFDLVHSRIGVGYAGYISRSSPQLIEYARQL
jgi:hypothetical protein